MGKKRKDTLREPLPSVKEYLERIGAEDVSGATLETLDTLIRQQLYSVPFENLDVCVAHKPISTAIPDLFDKIVRKKRGGYCFELNTLYAQLLEDMGFQAEMVFCRGVRERDEIRPCLHCAVIVTFPDGPYFSDIGFGGPVPGGALKVEDGFSRVVLGQEFGIEKDDEYWWTLWRTTSEGIREDVMQFNLFPQARAEFIPANAFCSGPGSYFEKELFLNRRTPDGNYALNGRTFRIYRGKDVTVEEIGDDERLKEVIDQYFGLGEALKEVLSAEGAAL